MPAAAVIPAPIAYIKVVAVKKLVVEFLGHSLGPLDCATPTGASSSLGKASALSVVRPASFTVKKLECLKQAIA